MTVAELSSNDIWRICSSSPENVSETNEPIPSAMRTIIIAAMTNAPQAMTFEPYRQAFFKVWRSPFIPSQSGRCDIKLSIIDNCEIAQSPRDASWTHRVER